MEVVANQGDAERRRAAEKMNVTCPSVREGI